MRPVRFTMPEWEAVCDALNHTQAVSRGTPATARALKKMHDAMAPGAVGVAAGPIEEALVRTARGKVVALASGPSGYARASKLATAQDVSVQDAELVGAWLARQQWLREPTTLLGVLNKWAEWLPRARATAPPPATQEGYGAGETGPGADGPGGGSGRRGRSPGFR